MADDKGKTTGDLVGSILSRVSINPSQATAFRLRVNPILTLTERHDPANNARFLTNKTRTISAIPPKLLEVLELLIAGEANWPLTLWGTPGTGKTCAALATLDRVAGDQRREWKGRAIYGRAYFTMSDYCLRANSAKYDGTGETHQGFMEKIDSSALIVLDELDRMANVSDNRHEELTNLLDRREGMPLILISNSDPDTLGQMYGGRVPSRLANGIIFPMSGPDRRIHKDKK